MMRKVCDGCGRGGGCAHVCSAIRSSLRCRLLITEDKVIKSFI